MTTLGVTLAYLRSLEHEEESITAAAADGHGKMTGRRKSGLQYRTMDSVRPSSRFSMVSAGNPAPTLVASLQ